MGYPPVHVERRKQRGKEALCLPLTIHSPHSRGWPMLQRVSVRSCLTTEPHRRNSEKSCWAFKTRSRTAVCECFFVGIISFGLSSEKATTAMVIVFNIVTATGNSPGGEWDINHDFVLLLCTQELLSRCSPFFCPSPPVGYRGSFASLRTCYPSMLSRTCRSDHRPMLRFCCSFCVRGVR